MLPGHLRGALLTALVTILLPVPGFASPIESGAAFRPGPVSQDSLGAAAQDPSPPGPTIHAVRAPHPPTIDAVLDEPFWHEIEPVTDFRQRVPVDGATSSERTEFRVAFDDDYLYFAIVLHDTDPEGIRRSILHREGRIDQDDNIRIGLDTYHDRRNAYIFEINPFGTTGRRAHHRRVDGRWRTGTGKGSTRARRESPRMAGWSRRPSPSRPSVSPTWKPPRWGSSWSAPYAARTRWCTSRTSARRSGTPSRRCPATRP